MAKKNIFLLLIVFQLCFLTGMIFFHMRQLACATKIFLKTIPYDPKSIFRGAYADLRYEINTLPVTLLKDISFDELKKTKSRDFFILLEKKDGDWQAQGIYKNQPRDGKLYLCARLDEYALESYWDDEKDKKLRFVYGIEAFFLNERRAGEVSRLTRGQWGDPGAYQEARKKKISELDKETQRISQASISDWWAQALYKELTVWVEQGIINQAQKDTLQQKYTQALEKIEKIDRQLSSGDTALQKPVMVEVAVDRRGYGHALRIMVDGKEYK